MPQQTDHAKGLLGARPSPHAPLRSGPVGTRPLFAGGARDGLLHAPPSVGSGQGLPLLIMLHGAGASASDVMPMIADCADRHSVLVLAPDSRGPTWDVIRRQYGPDVSFLDHALAQLFESYAVDPERIAIAGFSDGGSYALSLGLINGAFFRDIIAFSPGFAAPTRTEDAPRIFISHGRDDRVLPIERCGRRVAAALAQSGYDADYREFIGGHVVPADMVEAAVSRFVRL